MSSTDSRVDGRQSGVIAEPSFLEDESSPARFRRFAHSPETALWESSQASTRAGARFPYPDFWPGITSGLLVIRPLFDASIARKTRSGIRPSRASRAARRMPRRFLLPTETPPCLSVFRRERQFGRLSFFTNAAYRGSWRKFFNRGSTLVRIRPELRWT
jgi:hypothetical protein